MEKTIYNVTTFSEFIDLWNRIISTSENLEYDLKQLITDLNIYALELNEAEIEALLRIKNSILYPISVKTSCILQRYRSTPDEYIPFQAINQ